jgi:4-hydroxy-tetrahydrodipicolinate synthase
MHIMSKKFVPKGVMPALVTPFDKNEEIMDEGLREVIDYTINNGVTGVVPAGTTGEFIYMSNNERKRILQLTVEHTNGRVPVIAGTGQSSTDATIKMTQYAADIGCDAALIVSPFYLRPTDKGYYEHYATIASKCDIPIILYVIPWCTLGIIPPNVVEDLADLDNIVGIKDSSGDMRYNVELVQRLKGKIPVLIGHDECFLSAISAGASAAILASANVVPHILLEIMNKVRSGDIKEAAKLQHSIQVLTRIIDRNGGAPPVKAALKMMGLKAGKSRMPLDSGGTLTWELKEEIRIELEKLGLIDQLVHSPLEKEQVLSDMLGEFGFSLDQFQDAKFGIGMNDMVSVSVVRGHKKSTVGEAFVRLLTSPKIGHEALTVILEPNLPVKPSSIMMPVKKIESMRQASLFYGPVQSGAAKAVTQLLRDEAIPEPAHSDHVMIFAVDIDLNARDRRDITKATEQAAMSALKQVWG